MTATSELRAPITARRVRSAGSSFLAAAARALARQVIALAFVIVSTGVFTVRSVYAHMQYRTNSFDLGIFGQGVKGYAEGRGPVSAIKGQGYSLLGDHFSPINALLAPVYAAFPSIVVLLIAQAFLVALGAAPLIVWARRALGAWQAIAVGLVFTTSFGVASAIGFDFHEVAWAVPMLSVSLCALGQTRYRTAAAAALPLVLVKEDLGVTVAMIGLVLVLRRQRMLGAAVGAFGLASTALEVLVLIPLANAAGRYDYSAQSAGLSLSSLLHQTPQVTEIKVTTVVLTLSVGLFLATRSTILLIAVPTILWRLVGTNAGYWTMNYQYSLVLMPVLVAAFVEVLVRERERAEGSSTPYVRWALIGAVAVNLVLGLNFPLGDLLRTSFWHQDPRVGAMQRAVALVPKGATVSATNNLVPQLVDKSTVTVFAATTQVVPGGGGVTVRATLDGPLPEWIVVDLDSAWPESPEARAPAIATAEQDGYRQVSREDDVVVLKHTA